MYALRRCGSTIKIQHSTPLPLVININMKATVSEANTDHFHAGDTWPSTVEATQLLLNQPSSDFTEPGSCFVGVMQNTSLPTQELPLPSYLGLKSRRTVVGVIAGYFPCSWLADERRGTHIMTPISQNDLTVGGRAGTHNFAGAAPSYDRGQQHR